LGLQAVYGEACDGSRMILGIGVSAACHGREVESLLGGEAVKEGGGDDTLSRAVLANENDSVGFALIR
jgi:hypothetical protein